MWGDCMEEIKKQYNLEYSDQFAFENEENRSLWLNREIDDEALDDIVYSILRYNRLDNADNIPANQRIPIKLYINSPGGSVSCGFSIIDAISTSMTPVYTINVGYAYSMAFVIFLAGHCRFAMPNSTFLMHDGSTGIFWDSSAKVADRINFEQNQIEARTKDFIISNTNIDSETYDDKYRTEYYFYAQEGQEIGVVDYIIGTDCGLNEVL